ncbi:MAG: pseudouridine synthase [Oscillospiraceae bacterium]
MMRLLAERDAPRLDRFILAALPHLSGGRLHRALRENKLKLNGKKLPLSTPVHRGDEVCLYLPEALLAPPAPQVLYEDDGLLALNKPAGRRSQNETGPQDGTLLQDARLYLQAHRAPAHPGFEPSLCHRLDTGTSGVLLVAKTPEALAFVTGLLRRHALEKTYWGLAVGCPAPAAGTLAGYLSKDTRRAQVRVLPQPARGAAPVRLQYTTLATSGRLALLEITPHTGRTHQIRAQLAAAGTPLLGDSKYGDITANRALRCRYQCLCAGRLQFPAQLGGPFAHYAGLAITCEKPWFYAKALDGSLRW